MNRKFATCFVFFVVATAAALVYAQGATSTKSGVYTAEQANQGKVLYTQQCAMCHGDKLQGAGQNPSLASDKFLQNWQGSTVADLYTQIQSTMPATKPGSLKSEEVSALIAYILSANKYPAGSTALPSTADGLKKITFELPAAPTH